MTHDNSKWYEGQLVRFYPHGNIDLSYWFELPRDSELVQSYVRTIYKVVEVDSLDGVETVIRVEPNPAEHFVYHGGKDPWFSADYFEPLTALELLALEAI